MPKKTKQLLRQIALRQSQYRGERTVKSRARARLRRKQSWVSAQSRFLVKAPKYNRAGKNTPIDLAVPETLDLMKNYEETCEFLRDIGRITPTEKRPLRLVFDKVKTIKPAALLLLLAQLHQCRLRYGPKKATGTYPTDARIEKMLDATGFFKILGVRSRSVAKKKSYPLEYIEFLSEHHTKQGTARRLREEIFGEVVQMAPNARRQLTRAVDEAMLNAGQHAYPKILPRALRESGRRWWIVGHVNKPKGELTVLFCDLGVGIPQTLPKRYAMEKILAALAYIPGVRPNDAEMIQAGMTIGRTRTKEENRGKGLNDLRRFVDEAGEGNLHIFSRKGHYCYKPGGHERLRNFLISIGGTLIQWTVPLSKVSNWTSVDDEPDKNEDNQHS